MSDNDSLLHCLAKLSFTLSKVLIMKPYGWANVDKHCFDQKISVDTLACVDVSHLNNYETAIN